MEGSLSHSPNLEEVIVENDVDPAQSNGPLEVRILSPGRNILNLRLSGETKVAETELLVRFEFSQICSSSFDL